MKKDLNWGVGICHYTGTLVREGFYLQTIDKYFSTEELLVQYLREIDNEVNTDGEPVTDEFLLEEWYDADYNGDGYYYSTWHHEDANYLEIEGDIYDISNKQKI